MPNPAPLAVCSDLDLFSESALANPYPLYRQLRDLGPAAYLRSQGVWFLGRYDVVKAALGDWETWSSAQGVGLNPLINEAWKSALISVDPPAHTAMRTLFTDRLGPRHLQAVNDTIARRAEELAERIKTLGRFYGIRDVAQDLPVNVIMDLIGWPDDVRGELLSMAEGSFNACGPEGALMRGALPRLDRMMSMVARVYDEDRLTPGGFGATISNAARRGDIPREAAIGMLVGYVVAAFDTTINAIGSGLLRFARHPDQWDLLRANPTLAAGAFEEAVRIDSPLQYFSRVATRDVQLDGGLTIPSGARAVVCYASANRDERHFVDPDRFDITRRRNDHIGFGAGPHSCAGQGLARLEGQAVFKALPNRIRHLAVDEEPTPLIANVAHGWSRIPLRVMPE